MLGVVFVFIPDMKINLIIKVIVSSFWKESHGAAMVSDSEWREPTNH